MRNAFGKLLQSLASDRTDAWMEAAVCFLSAHLNRLDVSLRDLPSELLTAAAKFMGDQGSAVAFANSFFKYDLGISTFEQWPAEHTAVIVLQLAIREEKPEQKLQLLLKGYWIHETNVRIQRLLAMQLQDHILRVQEGGSGSDMEGALLEAVFARRNSDSRQSASEAQA